MAMVCLNVEVTTNHCLQWAEMVQPTLLPQLTLVQGNAIGFACLMVFATVFVVKMCIKALH